MLKAYQIGSYNKQDSKICPDKAAQAGQYWTRFDQI